MNRLVMVMLTALIATGAMAKDFKVRVANLNCQNCANRMEAALKKSDKVKKVEFDLPAKTVTISYKGKKSNEAAIRQIITDAKFNIVGGGEAMPGSKDAKAKCSGSSCGSHEGAGHCSK